MNRRPREPNRDRADATARHECGGFWHLVTETANIRMRGADLVVDQELYRCDGCGDSRVTMKQVAAAQEAAAAKLREQERLLTPEQIRQIRNQLGLTQEQLEAALGLGAKTVVRWEAGKVIPQRATDDLLRLIDRDPTALLFLAEHHGVELPQEVVTAINADRVSTDARPEETGAAETPFPAAAGKSLELPAPLWAKVCAAAEAQQVDPRTYLVIALVEHLTDMAWKERIDLYWRDRVDEMASALRKSWVIPTPRVPEEPWKTAHEEEYGAAI